MPELPGRANNTRASSHHPSFDVLKPCVPKTVEAHVLPHSLPASAESSFYLPTPKQLILFHNIKKKHQTNRQRTFSWLWEFLPEHGTSSLVRGQAGWQLPGYEFSICGPAHCPGRGTVDVCGSDCETQSAGTVGVL